MVKGQGSQSEGSLEGGISSLSESLEKSYLQLEDKWYDFCDFLQEKGVPVYPDYVDPLEKQGLPSFPFSVGVAVVLLLVVFLVFFLPSPQGDGAFVLRVASTGGNPVAGAFVKVYYGNSLIYTAKTTSAGSVALSGLPRAPLSFTASAAGYEPVTKEFDFSKVRTGLIALRCVAESCREKKISLPSEVRLCSDKSCVITPPLPKLKPTPRPGQPPPTTRTVECELDGSCPPIADAPSASLSVTLRVNGTGILYTDDANVSLLEYPGLKTIGSQQADFGFASFSSVKPGMRLMLAVSGPQILLLEYGKPAGEELVLQPGEFKQLTLSVAKTDSSKIIPTFVGIVGEDGEAITARLRVFKKGDSTPFFDGNVSQPRLLLLQQDVEYVAEATAPGYAAITFPIVPGADSSISLPKLVVVTGGGGGNVTNASSCSVQVSGFGENAVLQQGERVAITVSYSNLNASSANVSCGASKVVAQCANGSCSAACSFSSIGSPVFSARMGALPCVVSQNIVVVQPLHPYCQLLLPDSSISRGESARAIVVYSDAGAVSKSGIPISCNGKTVVAGGCEDGQGTCSAQCGPFSEDGSHAVTALLGNASCSATLQVGDADGCRVLLDRPRVFVGENFTATIFGAASNAKVFCGGSLRDAICAGGACKAVCSEREEGSHAVIAFAGSSSCDATIDVEKIICSGNNCGGGDDSTNTGGGSGGNNTNNTGGGGIGGGGGSGGSVQEFSCSVSAFPQVAGVGERVVLYATHPPNFTVSAQRVSFTCGNNGVAQPVVFNSTLAAFQSACFYSTVGFKEFSASINAMACEAQASFVEIVASTPTPIPTATPTPCPTCEPTATPTATPTPCPACEPTVTPTPSPTPALTPTPTAVPTATPSPTPPHCVIAASAPRYFTAERPLLGVVFSGVDAQEVINAQSIGASCNARGNSGAGTAAISSCTQLSGDEVECVFTCNYAAPGTKFASVSKFGASCNSPDFVVESVAGRSCTLNASATRVNVGQKVLVTASYPEFLDDFGNRLFLSPKISCGNYIAGDEARELPASLQAACPPSNGSCTFECNYAANIIDLSKTISMQPSLTGFEGSANEFACVLVPPVAFTDTPAGLRVNISLFNIPARGAKVSLFKAVGGAEIPCNYAVTGADGVASFTSCSLNGEFLHSLTTAGSVKAIVSYDEVPGLQLLGEATVPLQKPLSVGFNEINLQLSFPRAAIALSLFDAVTRRQEAALSQSTTIAYCRKLNVGNAEFLQESFEAGRCSGSSCGLQTIALLNCFANSTAPGYRDASFDLPTVPLQSLQVPHSAFLVPLSLPAGSVFTLKSVFDVEESGGFLPLDSLSLKKGFSYIAKFDLATSTVSQKAGAFFSASNSSDAFVYDASTVSFESTGAGEGNSRGQLIGGVECGASQLDFSRNSEGNYDKLYNWVERWVFNNIGGKSFAETPKEFAFQFKVAQDALQSVGFLQSRSFTYDGSATPKYSLSPSDVDVLLGSKPFCKAVVNSKSYALGETKRECSPDGAYCITLYFAQPGVSSETRGDGFTAQSASKCDPAHPENPNNAEHCRGVMGFFVLENSDIANANLENSYQLELSSQENLPIKQLLLSGFDERFGGGAALLQRQSDVGVISATPTKFVVDLQRLYQLGGFKSVLAGQFVATPLDSSSRVDVSVNYSSPSKSARRSSYLRIVPRTGVSTRFAEFSFAPSFSQLEQIRDDGELDAASESSYTNATMGDVPFAVVPEEYRSSMFNASVDDCAQGILGYGCQPVRIDFAFTSLQAVADAKVLFAADSIAEFSSAQFTVKDSSGAEKRVGVVTLSGNSPQLLLGALSAYDRVSGSAFLRFKTIASPTKVSVDFVFSQETDGKTRFSYWLNSVGKYGLLELKGADAFTGAALKPLFTLRYLARNYPACDSLSSSCVYRLKPTLFQDGGCGEGASGCVNASLQSYANGSAKIVVGKVSAGERNELIVHLANSSLSASSVSSFTILSESGVPLCATPPSTLPDCSSPSFRLEKGSKYLLGVNGSFGSGTQAGVFVNLGGQDKAFFTALPQQLSTSSGVLAVRNYSIGSSTSSCPLQQDFFATAVAQKVSSELPSWVQLFAAAPPTQVSFNARFAFNVTRDASAASTTISFNTFVVRQSVVGDAFIRSPQDALMGFGFPSNWCSAATAQHQVAIAAPATMCNAAGCVTVNYQQAIADPPEGGSGFNAVSKIEHERFSSSPYIPLRIIFSIDAKQNSVQKALSFATNASHLAATKIVFEKFCEQPPFSVPAAESDNFVVVADACSDVSAVSDIAGFIEANALQTNSGAETTPVNVSFTAQSSVTAQSSIVVVAPPAAPQSQGATITLSSRQRIATGGYENSQFYSLRKQGFSPCSPDEMDFATLQTGSPKCHHGYVELDYNIVSLLNGQSPSLKLEIIGDAVISGSQAVSPYDISSGSVTVGLTGFDVGADRKSVALKAGQLSSVSIGQNIRFRAKIVPTGIAPVVVRLSFGNGFNNVKLSQLPVTAISSSGVRCEETPQGCDLPKIFPCGNAALSLGISQSGGTPVLTSSCNNVNLAVDSIFPADAVPIELSPGFESVCGSLAGLVRFERVEGSRDISDMLKTKMVGVNGVQKLFLTFNAFRTGSPRVGLESLVKGNRFYYAGQEILPGREIGKAKMVFSCAGSNPQKREFTITAKVAALNGATGFSAIDGSSLPLGSDASHWLFFTAYNGQFSEDLRVQSASGEQSVPLRFNPASRVNYFLGGGSAVPASIFASAATSPPNFELQDIERTGVSIAGRSLRGGNIYSALIAASQSDGAVRAALDEFARTNNFDARNPASFNTQQGLAYASILNRYLPQTFAGFAKDVAAATAFRRSSFNGVYHCAYAKSKQPFSCNSAGQLVLDSPRCGCPPGWRPQANSCVPIYLSGVEKGNACSDGTPAGQCSAFAQVRCDAVNLALAEDASCALPAPRDANSCPDGTPRPTGGVVHCALQASGANGAVAASDLQQQCRASEVQWTRPFVEEESIEASCRSCADIVDDLELDDVESIGYAPSPRLSLSLATPYIPFPSATDVRALEVFAKTISLSLEATDLQNVTLPTIEYRSSSSSECPILGNDPSKWCTDAGAFKANSPNASMLILASKAPRPPTTRPPVPNSSTSWLKDYVFSPPPGSSSGTWVVRAKARGAGGSDLYSNPLRIVVEYPVEVSLSTGVSTSAAFTAPEKKACIYVANSSDPDYAFSCGIVCDFVCREGKKRVVVRSEVGAISGDKYHWENATPIYENTQQAVGIEVYKDFPYRAFADELGNRPFSLSSPLAYWGWHKDAVADFTLSSSQQGQRPFCDYGIGYYEMRASSADGSTWSKSLELKKLPLANYILGDEPRDYPLPTPQPTHGTESPYLGQIGCSVHSERRDAITICSKRRILGIAVGKRCRTVLIGNWPLGEPRENDKWLCNVKQRTVSDAVFDVYGQADCVQYCSNPYCGNCGVQPYCSQTATRFDGSSPPPTVCQGNPALSPLPVLDARGLGEPFVNLQIGACSVVQQSIGVG